MSMRRGKYFAMAAFIICLASCGSPESVLNKRVDAVSSFPKISEIYSTYSVAYASKQGSFPVVILGNPFSIPKRVAHEKIISALILPRWFAPADFMQRPVNAQPIGHRLVLVFNPSKPMPSAEQLCGSLESINTSLNMLRVRAVFCAGQRSLSKVDGWMTASHPDDSNFQSFMNTLIASLLPSWNMKRLSLECISRPRGRC